MRSCTQARATCCMKHSTQAAPAVSAFHYDPDRDLIVIGQREGTVQRYTHTHARTRTHTRPHDTHTRPHDTRQIVWTQQPNAVARLCYSEIFAQNRFLMGMPGSAVMRLHSGLIHRVQMDAYKVLTSGQDGVIGGTLPRHARHGTHV